MPRIINYPEEASPSANDVLLIDGENGSRKVKVSSILGNVIAPVEQTSTSSKNYAIGDQFIFNGLLTEATAAINQGSTIIVGNSGNAKLADSVAKQLTDLNNDLTALSNYDTYSYNNYYRCNFGKIVIQRIKVTLPAAASGLWSAQRITWTSEGGVSYKYTPLYTADFIGTIYNTNLYSPVFFYSDENEFTIAVYQPSTALDLNITAIGFVD